MQLGHHRKQQGLHHRDQLTWHQAHNCQRHEASTSIGILNTEVNRAQPDLPSASPSSSLFPNCASNRHHQNSYSSLTHCHQSRVDKWSTRSPKHCIHSFFSHSMMCSILLVITILFHFTNLTDSTLVPETGFCVPKSQASDIKLVCKSMEKIAIHEAYFTSEKPRFECPFLMTPSSSPSAAMSFSPPAPPQYQPGDVIKYKQDPNVPYNLQPMIRPCTDDLRLSFNAKCSGHDQCRFDLAKDHYPPACAEDGYLIVKYSCVPSKSNFSLISI